MGRKEDGELKKERKKTKKNLAREVGGRIFIKVRFSDLFYFQVRHIIYLYIQYNNKLSTKFAV